MCNRIEMGHRYKTRADWFRVFALTLAVLVVLLVAQALTHSHANGQNEAACQICQAAHLGAAPKAGAGTLCSPLVNGDIQPFFVTIHQELFSHDSPSRAPPSA
jgi:hypothetical protein